MTTRAAMDAVTSTVKQAFFHLASINPPPADASPRTLRSFRRMVTTIAQASGQTLFLAVGMGQQIEDANGRPIDLHLGLASWREFLIPSHSTLLTVPVPLDNLLTDHDDEDPPIDERNPGGNNVDDGASGNEDGDHDRASGNEDGDDGVGSGNEGSNGGDDEATDASGNEGSNGGDDEATDASVRQRVREIFLDTEDDGDGYSRYTLTDFFNMAVRGGYKGKVRDEEQEAFRRMVIGYNLVPGALLVRFPLPDIPSLPTNISFRAIASDVAVSLPVL